MRFAIITVAVVFGLSQSASAEVVCNRNITFDFANTPLPPNGGVISGTSDQTGYVYEVRAYVQFDNRGTTFDAANLDLRFFFTVVVDGVRIERQLWMTAGAWSGQGVFGVDAGNTFVDGALELDHGAPHPWRLEIINRNPAAGPIAGTLLRCDVVLGMASCHAGDLNCDGVVDQADLEAFQIALMGVDEYQAAYPNCQRTLADLNHDRVVDERDLDPLVCCVAAGGCENCIRSWQDLYDGTVLPTQSGWTIADDMYEPNDIQPTIEDGWLVQHVEWLPDLQVSQQDFYRKSIAQFAGRPTFLAEARLTTDGPRTGIPSGSPAIFSVSGTAGVFYHFTISEDQVRLINSQVQVFLFDIAAGVPHTLRLEVFDQSYDFWLDGAKRYSGVTNRPYPESDSVILFGARAPLEGATTRWDYIRHGDMFAAQRGDANCDGVVNNFDIDAFVLALSDLEAYTAQRPDCSLAALDLNADGHIDNFDIDPFVACLIAGGCP